MYSASVVSAALALLCQSGNVLADISALPINAQFIDQKAFNALPSVLPPSQFNGSSVYTPPGYTLESLSEKPFHVYHPDFIALLGSHPTLTLLAKSPSDDPIFHEAVVWHPQTDDVFFAQNAGSPAAGTGLNKTAVIQKISLRQADLYTNETNVCGKVDVTVVRCSPQVINPNGGTNYRGQIVFGGEGEGADVPPTAFLMNPAPPYNTTVLFNNYFGRQFNSLNDLAVHPKNKDLYFTDVSYGWMQEFRPSPALPNQVYRYNSETGALTVVADGFFSPNGITFSPDGSYAYVTDTGVLRAFFGQNYTLPATVYRYNVQADGTLENRKTFAYVTSGAPDGFHADSKGNLYAGCGDGINVWNPSGTLIGKIYTASGIANFAFAGNRIVMMAETKLYYAVIGVEGNVVQSELAW